MIAIPNRSANQPWLPACRRDLFGVPAWAVSSQSTTATVLDKARQRERGFVAVANVYTLMTAYFDPAFLAIYGRANLVIPDGKPLVWALNSFRQGRPRLVNQVAGASLMLDVLDQGRAMGLRHYLYGGKNGSSKDLQESLEKQLPGVHIVGRFEPPFRAPTENEDTEQLAAIAACSPHVIWVGIGAPKQEQWMSRMRDRLPTMAVGVGAAFDFHSGRMRRAPQWLARMGLEWAFRLALEPRRLWRRYFWSNPRFLALWARELVLTRRKIYRGEPIS